MILILCPRCKCALRVTGDLNEAYNLVGPSSEFWPDKFTCFRCEKPAQGFLESEVAIKAQIEIKEVSPQEAYAAIHGLGILEERDFDKLTIDALLREQPIRRIGGKDLAGGGRTVIDYLELWDGTRVHLGASHDGAVIYRITRPHSYVSKVTP